MLNVRLAGDHLYGKWLFTWLSLVMSSMAFFLCCPFSHEMSWMIFWYLIGSVFGGGGGAGFLPTLT